METLAVPGVFFTGHLWVVAGEQQGLFSSMFILNVVHLEKPRLERSDSLWRHQRYASLTIFSMVFKRMPGSCHSVASLLEIPYLKPLTHIQKLWLLNTWLLNVALSSGARGRAVVSLTSGILDKNKAGGIRAKFSLTRVAVKMSAGSHFRYVNIYNISIYFMTFNCLCHIWCHFL